jgi:integrase
MTRHAKAGALNDREFELLLEGARSLDEYHRLGATFVVNVAGRLGLRRGEIAHMDESWIDWRERMIRIPATETCTKGRDGGPCGDCRKLAEQAVEHNPDLSLEDAIADRWKPKTDNAVRAVPFDWDSRAELAVERFFEEFDRYPWSVQSVNRRAKRAARAAAEISADDVFPHGLRATAASRMAAKGLEVLTLQSMLGWADPTTARKYVTSSGEQTARALHHAHSG